MSVHKIQGPTRKGVPKGQVGGIEGGKHVHEGIVSSGSMGAKRQVNVKNEGTADGQIEAHSTSPRSEKNKNVKA